MKNDLMKNDLMKNDLIASSSDSVKFEGLPRLSTPLLPVLDDIALDFHYIFNVPEHMITDYFSDLSVN